ncbi:MAG: hypothetical protein HYZ28_18630 [Myxococcales bacterium]|nr:hypothetical protein [Myxococcales bacterium]
MSKTSRPKSVSKQSSKSGKTAHVSKTKPKKETTVKSTAAAEAAAEIPMLDDLPLPQDVPVADPAAEAAGPSAPDQGPKPARKRMQRDGREVTCVALEKLLAIVAEAGLKVDEKKAWLKVAGPSGARVYLPRREVVGQVNVAGFEAPAGTSVQLGARSFGSVKERLDMEGSEERVLERFRAILQHMKSLPREEAVAERKQEPRIVVAEGR